MEDDSESSDESGDEGKGEGSGESSGAFCHIHLSKISRGKGRSATGAAAYRSGTKITDTRNRRRHTEAPRRRVATEAAAYRSGEAVADEDEGGRVHDYRRKQGVKKLLILLPPGAPWEYMDRSTLWNAAEDAEVRRNACVAREFNMALPCDLPEDEQWGICTDIGQWLLDNYGVAVDIALHAPAAGEGHDQRNDHAHVMFTSRVVDVDGFGDKTRIFDKRDTGPLQVIALRQAYADFTNARLEKFGLPYRLDPRTLEAQGIDRIPQIHVGPNGWAVKFDGRKNPDSHTRADFRGRVIEWEKIDEGETRAGFCERIKNTNRRREAFGPVPLHVQIDNIGRYIQADPSGFNGGLNLYAYAGQNPTQWVDPTGLIYCQPGDVQCQKINEATCQSLGGAWCKPDEPPKPLPFSARALECEAVSGKVCLVGSAFCGEFKKPAFWICEGVTTVGCPVVFPKTPDPAASTAPVYGPPVPPAGTPGSPLYGPPAPSAGPSSP